MLVSGKPFQLSLMFLGEARSLPKGAAPERCFIRVSCGLTRTANNKIRLERLAMDKHSSLLQKSVNYGRNSSTGPKIVNDASRSVIDHSRVTLQLWHHFHDDHDDCKMFILQATGLL
jgi:hypothetical protein